MKQIQKGKKLSVIDKILRFTLKNVDKKQKNLKEITENLENIKLEKKEIIADFGESQEEIRKELIEFDGVALEAAVNLAKSTLQEQRNFIHREIFFMSVLEKMTVHLTSKNILIKYVRSYLEQYEKISEELTRFYNYLNGQTQDDIWYITEEILPNTTIENWLIQLGLATTFEEKYFDLIAPSL